MQILFGDKNFFASEAGLLRKLVGRSSSKYYDRSFSHIRRWFLGFEASERFVQRGRQVAKLLG
ncbi:hypothetical protein J2T14_004073 [Paenibacillus harenae]|nr:hypothetical protein [Paenibacillus harenae]